MDHPPSGLGDADRTLLDVLFAAADAVATALATVTDWGPSGLRSGQYAADLAADTAAIGVLEAAGLAVLSEESGRSVGGGDLVAIVDPLDGSTNASHGIPWFATSICVVDATGPRVGMVANQAVLVGGGAERYWAVRDGGAWVRHASPGGRPAVDTALAPSGATELNRSIVGLSGLPPRYLGWKQFRSLGASALDLCLVAAGTLDAYIDCSRNAHGVWDYAAALLVCAEAGAPIADALERELIVLDHDARRTPVAAGTDQLLAEALAARRTFT